MKFYIGEFPQHLNLGTLCEVLHVFLCIEVSGWRIPSQTDAHTTTWGNPMIMSLPSQLGMQPHGESLAEANGAIHKCQRSNPGKHPRIVMPYTHTYIS
jgi:hypothetical protein